MGGLGLGAGYGAGGAADALMQLVKQRLLEKELHDREEQAAFERTMRTQDGGRADARLSLDQQQEARAKEAQQTQTGMEQLKALDGRPNADLADPTTTSAAPSGPGLMGTPSFKPFQGGTIAPVTIGGRSITPISQEALTSQAQEAARAKEATTVREVPDGGALVQNGKVVYENPKAAPMTPQGSDYQQFLHRFAASKGTTVDKMSVAEELAARKAYGQADDRPVQPQVLRIQTVDADGKPVTKVVGKNEALGQSFAAAPTTDQRNRTAAAGRSSEVLNSIAELSEKINTGQGMVAKAQGEAAKQAAKLNLNDDVSEYQALVSMFTPLLARAVGHTGVLTEQDVQSVRAGLPQPGDSKSVRDRKMARIDKIMAGMGAPTSAPSGDSAGGKTGAPTAADLIKKYGG